MTPPWVAALSLQPHPEGGWFRETWRAPGQVSTPRGPRAASTGILFGLPAGGHSAWHRVESHEVWLCHQGTATLWLFDGEREVREITLSPDPTSGAPQAEVPAGWWQATEAATDALFSCVVTPGFDFADFALVDADTLDAWCSVEPELAPLWRRLGEPGAR